MCAVTHQHRINGCMHIYLCITFANISSSSCLGTLGDLDRKLMPIKRILPAASTHCRIKNKASG
jgi:hypothetical protein